jgi:hypothetical protein
VIETLPKTWSATVTAVRHALVHINHKDNKAVNKVEKNVQKIAFSLIKRFDIWLQASQI